MSNGIWQVEEAQWWNICNITPRLRVQDLPLALAQRHIMAKMSNDIWQTALVQW
jgi:hypothetical protein